RVAAPVALVSRHRCCNRARRGELLQPSHAARPAARDVRGIPLARGRAGDDRLAARHRADLGGVRCDARRSTGRIHAGAGPLCHLDRALAGAIPGSTDRCADGRWLRSVAPCRRRGRHRQCTGGLTWSGPGKVRIAAHHSRPMALDPMPLRLSTEILTLHTRHPFIIARGSNSEYRTVMVKVTDADGAEGWGEAAATRFYGETLETV